MNDTHGNNQHTTQDDSAVKRLGFWVGSLSSAMRKGLERELAPWDVTAAQWAILEACFRGEANSPSGLARIIPVDLAAISRQLDKLKDKGLIRRRRLSSDRRSVRIELTEAGRALVPKLAPSVETNNAKFLKEITSSELTTVIETIQKMLENVETTVYAGKDLSNG